MVGSVSIGIIGIQGAISEHFSILHNLNAQNVDQDNCNVSIIRDENELKQVDGLIIPGGESTTISRFLHRYGLGDVIKTRVEEKSLAVMGTCAGCVILAKRLCNQDKDVFLLELMDMEVKRNAFGRQKQSFEHCIDISNVCFSFPAVFIRAPSITTVWGSCKLLASIDEKGVMARQGNMLAVSFHPELTMDLRLHLYFLAMVQQLKERNF